MAFPVSPIDGQEYSTSLGVRYKYVASDDKWVIMTAGLTGVTGIQGATGVQGETGASLLRVADLSSGIDTYMLDSVPDRNFGLNTHFWLTYTNSGGPVENRAPIIEWTGLPSVTAIVTDASVTLTYSPTSKALDSTIYTTFGAYLVSRDWTEGTHTDGDTGLPVDGASWQTWDGTNAWTTNLARGVGDRDMTPVGTLSESNRLLASKYQYTFVLNAYGRQRLTDVVNGSTTWYGIVLDHTNQTEISGTGVDFCSFQDTTVANRPRLYINYAYGMQGQTGVQGVQGATGVHGATGVQGATGIQGITGIWRGSIDGGAAATTYLTWQIVDGGFAAG